MKKIASWCDEVLDRVIDKRLKLAGDRDGDGAGRGKKRPTSTSLSLSLSVSVSPVQIAAPKG